MATMFCFQSSDRQLHDFLFNMLCFYDLIWRKYPSFKSIRAKKKTWFDERNVEYDSSITFYPSGKFRDHRKVLDLNHLYLRIQHNCQRANFHKLYTMNTSLLYYSYTLVHVLIGGLNTLSEHWRLTQLSRSPWSATFSQLLLFS